VQKGGAAHGTASWPAAPVTLGLRPEPFVDETETV